MKKQKKFKKITTVPLLCWDIYAEHLNTLLGRNNVSANANQRLSRKKSNP